MPETSVSAAASQQIVGDGIASLQDRVTQLTRVHSIYASALDAIPFPLVLVDAASAPIFVHRRAQTLLALADGLMLTPAGLSAHDRDRSTALRAAVADAVHLSRRSSFLVPRLSGRSSLVVVISPLAANPPLDPGVAAVLLIDPDVSPEIDEAGLRSLYGLTRAEATLVSILVRGRTLEEAADELCVSLSTVKTHLQRVFLKTDTARQAQLLRRLLIGHVPLG